MIGIKEIVLKEISRNTNWMNTLYKCYKKDAENQVAQLAQEMSKYDTIRNTESLLELKKKIIQDGKIYCSYNGNKTNFRLYGIGETLFGDQIDRTELLPATEHGLIFYNTNWSDTALTARASCITFGEFRKNILRKYYDTPIFEVGSYIQYAAPYYSEDKMREWKKENGKTVVVFPMHSTDDSRLSYGEKEYIKEIKKIATSYNTVLICMFWWNLDMPIVKAFKQEGFKIASAGYREDPMFLRRQRTMIEMADYVVTDAIGTHVGYCHKLGKSVEIINSGTKTNIYNDTFIKQQVKNVENAILSGDRNLIDNTMKFYWGNDISYSKEKLKSIAEINEEITIKGHYWVKNYSKVAQQLLEKYRESDEIKYSLLKRAMQ